MKWEYVPFKHPQKEGEWRLWFAWRPVRLTGTNQTIWLETVERKFVKTYNDCIMYDAGGKSWLYREIK